jgi:thioredoxin reductase (NADPH)
LIFATGVEDVGPGLSRTVEDEALRNGVLRYCPICDGREAVGRAIAVLGGDDHGAAEALFVRRYSDAVTLLALETPAFGPGVIEQLDAAGILIEPSPAREIAPGAVDVVVGLQDGRRLTFDVLYPALGSKPRSVLPLSLGVPDGVAGKVEAGAPLGGPRPGIFVAGDVVEGLDQISVAFGHGALAATRAHNYLRGLDAETLTPAG